MFSRPIRWIMAIHGDAVVPFMFAGILRYILLNVFHLSLPPSLSLPFRVMIWFVISPAEKSFQNLKYCFLFDFCPISRKACVLLLAFNFKLYSFIKKTFVLL